MDMCFHKPSLWRLLHELERWRQTRVQKWVLCDETSQRGSDCGAGWRGRGWKGWGVCREEPALPWTDLPGDCSRLRPVFKTRGSVCGKG